jgi:CheY-like chemotaxis protein
LAIFDKGAGFDLLLTDVVLPGGVSGLELVQRARDIDARVKVLLTSGYSKEVFHPHGGIDPALSILRKPYRRDDLAQQLRQIFYSKA